MGKVVKHKDDSWAILYVRVPGWLKNRVSKAAKKNKTSINGWVSNTILRALEDDRGLPPAPIGITEPPSPQQILEGYIVNRPPLEPCGVPAPCAREEKGTVMLDGFEYCQACRIRVR